jgi:hypothetical protein
VLGDNIRLQMLFHRVALMNTVNPMFPPNVLKKRPRLSKTGSVISKFVTYLEEAVAEIFDTGSLAHRFGQ